MMSFIVVSGFAGIEATYGLWTQARFGWGPRQIGFAFMAIGVSGAVAQGLVTGALARRYRRRRGSWPAASPWWARAWCRSGLAHLAGGHGRLLHRRPSASP